MLTQNIGVSKKKVRNHIIAYLILTLFFCWGFWYGTGKFFTEAYYYPAMAFLMPAGIIAMLVTTLNEIRFLFKTESFITLNDEGICFYGKYFDEIGFVKWADVERCADISVNGWVSKRYLLVYAGKPEMYSARISDLSQRNHYFRTSNKRDQALLWIDARRLDIDLTELKRTIFQMIEVPPKKRITF